MIEGEVEEEEEESSQVIRSSQSAAIAEYGERPHTSGIATRPKGKTISKTQKNLDEAIATIAESMSGTQRLQEQVDEVLKGGNNPRSAWTHWMATELMDLHEDLWLNFQKESFQLVMRYREQNKALRQQQQQQHTHQASAPSV